MLFLMALAAAGEVEVWQGTFPNDESVDGVDGWASGYSDDAWYSYISQNDGNTYVLPATDDYEEAGCDRWTGACANYLVNDAEDVTDGRFSTSIYSEDDDTLGVAFGHQNDSDYLLFVLCGEGDTSCPLADLGGQAALLHIDGNSATVLDSARASYELYTELILSVTSNDGQLSATFGDVTLSGEMPGGRQLNGVGLYSYNAGYGDNSNVYFWIPTLYALDTDDDGVIDDEDNCDDDSNADQADADDDGIGTACDDNEGGGGDNGGDNGGGDNGGDDTAPGTDDTSLDGSGVGPDTELKIAGGCACSSPGDLAGSGLAFAAVGVIGLAALRRRD